MPESVVGLNPKILTWARERAGLTIEDAAARMKKSVAIMTSWEHGKKAPTFKQLEKLAEDIYQRPIALFFFPAPPEEPAPGRVFRTLPSEEVDKLLPDTLYAMREGMAFRESLIELTGGSNPAPRLITRDIRARAGEDVEALAKRVREYLGIDLKQQFQWVNKEAALKGWRRAIENAGVFVFKRSFKQKGISGLCLNDSVFPLILVNNSTAHSRQQFTIFHELGHLLFDVSGITKDDAGFIRRLTGASRDIEVACNKFAAECLVPAASFPWNDFRDLRDLDNKVRNVATRYRVSREVILRWLLDRGLVTDELYEEKARRWNKEFLDWRASKKPGGNYYATQATYLGPSFLALAFGRLYAGRVTMPELADHLGVKAQNIPRLEAYIGAEV